MRRKSFLVLETVDVIMEKSVLGWIELVDSQGVIRQGLLKQHSEKRFVVGCESKFSKRDDDPKYSIC